MTQSLKTVDPKVRRKTRFKKVLVLFAVLAAALLIFVLLLFHRPAHYDRPEAADNKEVSQYLTHELVPQIYNGAQRQESFDLVIPQSRTKDIVALCKWPRQYGALRLAAPHAFFIADYIVLMGTVALRDMEFVVTVMVSPSLDQNGLLTLQVGMVRVGAVNVTFLARLIARQVLQGRLSAKGSDSGDIGEKIAVSLVYDEPFEPIFEVEDKNVRLKSVTIMPEKLILRLAPANPANHQDNPKSPRTSGATVR